MNTSTLSPQIKTSTSNQLVCSQRGHICAARLFQVWAMRGRRIRQRTIREGVPTHADAKPKSYDAMCAATVPIDKCVFGSSVLWRRRLMCKLGASTTQAFAWPWSANNTSGGVGSSAACPLWSTLFLHVRRAAMRSFCAGRHWAFNVACLVGCAEQRPARSIWLS